MKVIFLKRLYCPRIVSFKLSINSRNESKKKYLLVLFFMKRMNPFIEGSVKNGSGTLVGMI